MVLTSATQHEKKGGKRSVSTLGSNSSLCLLCYAGDKGEAKTKSLQNVPSNKKIFEGKIFGECNVDYEL